MRPDILIVGQGLAGTLLGWECERAGLAFAIADPGFERSATMAGAGIINPITGRRLVKSWRVEALLPAARSAYHALETQLDIPLWRDLRVRRLFADEGERQTFERKSASGELAPFASAEGGDDQGFWITGAGRVDLAALLAAMRVRWQAQGRLRHERVNIFAERDRHAWVIDCSGIAGTRSANTEAVSWECSKGELLELAVHGLVPDVVLNRRQWALPIREGVAWFGATHEPAVTDPAPTTRARTFLEASARELLKKEFAVTGQRAGVRVNAPDKLPVAGPLPDRPSAGVINALGAKGALFAPFLAAQWVGHILKGAPFEPAIDVRRFVKSGQIPS